MIEGVRREPRRTKSPPNKGVEAVDAHPGKATPIKKRDKNMVTVEKPMSVRSDETASVEGGNVVEAVDVHPVKDTSLEKTDKNMVTVENATSMGSVETASVERGNGVEVIQGGGTVEVRVNRQKGIKAVDPTREISGSSSSIMEHDTTQAVTGVAGDGESARDVLEMQPTETSSPQGDVAESGLTYSGPESVTGSGRSMESSRQSESKIRSVPRLQDKTEAANDSGGSGSTESFAAATLTGVTAEDMARLNAAEDALSFGTTSSNPVNGGEYTATRNVSTSI